VPRGLAPREDCLHAPKPGNVLRTPESIKDPAISLDDASGLMAHLGFVAFRTAPGDSVPESCLTVMIRSRPTGRHFDPELVTYWVHHGRAGHLELVDVHTAPPVFERFSWGKIQIADRFGISNSFATFGGFLYAERMDPDALLLVFRSSAPILRLAGHSQKRDAIAEEIMSFFARVVPHLWTPAEEQLVNARTPEELYAAFLVHVRRRLDGSAALREAMSGDVRMVDSELAIMAEHRPTALATGKRLLRELRLSG
jgi:hypothetical protein